MEPINLDNTKALERIAAALEDLSRAKGREIELNKEILELSKEHEQKFDIVSDAYDKWGDAADRVARETEKAGAEPAGITILLIVEVLIALIRFVRARRESPADRTELSRLLDKLKPYQPVRPAGKEAE